MHRYDQIFYSVTRLVQKWQQFFIQSSRWLVQYIAGLVLVTGLIDVASSLFKLSERKLAWTAQWFSPFVAFYSRTFTLLIGVFLIWLAGGLRARKRKAWQLSVVFVAVALVFHILKGFDWIESLLNLGVLCVLLPLREYYSVPSGKLGWRQLLGLLVAGYLLLFAYSAVGSLLLQNQFNRPVRVNLLFGDYVNSAFGVEPDQLVPRTRVAIWFEDSIVMMAVGLLVFALTTLLAPRLPKSWLTDAEQDRLRRWVIKHGQNSISYFALSKEKQWRWGSEPALQAGIHKIGLVAYYRQRDVCIALAEPIVAVDQSLAPAIKDFQAFAHQHGHLVTWFGIDHVNLKTYRRLGFKTLKIGEEAFLRSADFNLVGSQQAELRHCVNRLERLGAVYEWLPLDEVPLHTLRAVAQLRRHWLSQKQLQDLGFSMNYYPLSLEPLGRLLAVWSPTGELWAAVTWLPYAQKTGLALDFMLRSATAPNGTMEAAICLSIQKAHEMKVAEISLGMSPLSDVELNRRTNMLEKGLGLLYHRLNFFYGFSTLFKFKAKFHPQWRHKYLLFEQYLQLPKVLVAVLEAHLHATAKE